MSCLPHTENKTTHCTQLRKKLSVSEPLWSQVRLSFTSKVLSFLPAVVYLLSVVCEGVVRVDKEDVFRLQVGVSQLVVMENCSGDRGRRAMHHGGSQRPRLVEFFIRLTVKLWRICRQKIDKSNETKNLELSLCVFLLICMKNQSSVPL